VKKGSAYFQEHKKYVTLPSRTGVLAARTVSATKGLRRSAAGF